MAPGEAESDFDLQGWISTIGVNSPLHIKFYLLYIFVEDCQEPLGLENRNIKDEQLTASSAWDNDKEQFGAQRARLNLNRWPQGWTAHVEDRSPWLQVNLKNPYIITRIATQGFGGHINQWVKKYRITWENDEGIWYNYSVPRRSRSLAVHWNTKVILSHRFLFTTDLFIDTAAILNYLDLRSITGCPEGKSTFICIRLVFTDAFRRIFS